MKNYTDNSLFFLMSLSLILMPMDAVLILPFEILGVKLSIPRLIILITFLFLLFRLLITGKIPNVSGFWIIIFLATWYLLTLTWITVPIDNSLIVRKVFSVILACVIVFYSFLLEKRKLTTKFFLIIVTFSLFFALLEQIFGFRLYASRQHYFSHELTSFYINPSHLGSTLALLLPWIINPSFFRSFIKKLFQLALITLTVFTLIKTGSKGVIVASLLAVFILLIFKTDRRFFRIVASYFGVTLGIFYMMLKFNLISPILLEKLNYSSLLARESFISRAYIYKISLNSIAQRPLLGYGIGSSTLIIGGSPHNFLLELLLEGGIVNFACFAFFYALLLINLFIRRKNVFSKLCFASLVAFVPISLTVGSIFDLWSFWMVLGVSMFYAFNRKKAG